MKDATQTEDTNVATMICRHHWLIDIAAGPSSHGRCTQCGKERDFLNVIDDVLALQNNEASALAVA